MGVPVDGWDASAAGPPAEAALNAIDDGNELVATSLARIAHVAGTGDEAWNGYLARIAHRLDPGTGVYRLYYAPQGTIANTYTAMMTVVDHFPDLVSGAATATTVRTVVLEDSPNTGLDVDGNGGSGT